MPIYILLLDIIDLPQLYVSEFMVVVAAQGVMSTSCIYQSSRNWKWSVPHSERREKCCGQDWTLSVRHESFCSYMSLLLSSQFTPVGILNEPIQGPISKCGIGDAPVPFGNWDLCRDEGGSVVKVRSRNGKRMDLTGWNWSWNNSADQPSTSEFR